MTLSIVHSESSLSWGGQEIRILTEAAGMIARGHAVQLLASEGSRILDAAPRYGVPVTGLPMARKHPRGVQALMRWLAQHPVDVINTHSSTDSWLVALAMHLTRRQTPLVRTRHVSVPVPNNLATRWLYNRATCHIVTTGQALRAQLIRDNHVAPARVSSIPTGVDPMRFAPRDRAKARAMLDLPIKSPLIGIVATLRSWKGHRFLLDAFARVARTDAELVIVGGGPQRDALRAQAGQLGITPRVRFAGNQDDVAPWLSALDVFALPSYANEGVPQALVQAMCAGIPCITTDAGGISEIARHGETALVIAKEDARELTDAIDRLLDDDLLRQRLSAAGRHRVEGEFALSTMLDRMEAVFTTAVAARNAATAD